LRRGQNAWKGCFRFAAALLLAAISSVIGGCSGDPKPPVVHNAPAADPLAIVRIDLTGQSGVDAKLAALKAELEEANSVVLHKTDVTGAGLVHLKGAMRLKTLDLRDTSITDADLQKLRGMAQLNFLVLDGSKVTPAGVEEARQFLPRTAITPVAKVSYETQQESSPVAGNGHGT
jgi:hypothetical protein